MTRNSIQAFADSQTELAREVIEWDDQVDELFHRISRKLPDMHAENTLSVQDMTDILSVNSMAYNIERIGDNATNIAESAIYLIQGRDVKHLDHQNDAESLLKEEEQ